LQYKAFDEQRPVIDYEKNEKQVYTNVLGLDEGEVARARAGLLAGEPVDEINEKLTSFYIFEGKNGSLPRVIVRGGEYGLDEAHFQAVLEALERIDEVDPDFLEETNKTGAKFISARSSFMDFGPVETDLRASANDFHDSVFVNTNRESSFLKHEGDILVESYEVEAGRKYPDVLYIVDAISLDEIRSLKKSFPAYFGNIDIVTTPDGQVILNFGAYAMLKTAFWVTEHQSHLSQEEINELMGSVAYGYEHYVEKRLLKYLKENNIPFSITK